MNQAIHPETASNMYPDHVYQAYLDLYKRSGEVGCMPTIDRSSGMAAAEMTLVGRFGKDGHFVRISFIVGQEETVNVVFIKERPGQIDETVTRHYQPFKYLGKDADGKMKSRIFATNITRRPIDWLGLDALSFLKDGIFPIKEFKPELFNEKDFGPEAAIYADADA